MNLPIVNILAILPAIILALTGMALMVIDPFVAKERKPALAWIPVAGILGAFIAMIPMAAERGEWYAGLWRVDGYSLFFHAIFLTIAGLTVLTAIDYVVREQVPSSEFIILVLFSTTGALLMAGAGELMLIFIGIEILSIATYVLAGFRRTDLKSNESAIKYFLLGSFASAFFLYGVALVFGATRTTNLAEIAEAIRSGSAQMSLVYASAALMLTGLAFKVALAPFHVWTPDVYEGAPTPVTGFMSVLPKAAGFAVFIRIFQTAFPGIEERWMLVIWLMAALTMVIGNVVAVVQTNIKRMLAYSSIAHAGYIAVAFAAGSDRGTSAAMFYMLTYSITSLGAFGLVTVLARKDEEFTAVDDYRGLASKRPGLAALLTVFLLSLAGIPGTAGFAGKFFIFSSAVESGLLSLTVIGVLTTVVSFYYYLNVIVQMYMKDAEDSFDGVAVHPATGIALAITLALTLYLGILPTRVLEWATQSALLN
jgi:NADH-quinone oxidoreductase subunit N